jgi:hypothetical protein
MNNSKSNPIKQTMSKIIIIILMISLTILTYVISFTFINRLTMPYNSEGNYFDDKSCVVYNQQSIIVYGILLVFLLSLTIISVYKIIKKYKT